MEIRLAMVQMRVAAGARAENLTHAAALLAGACARERIDIAVLPECCDLGWANPAAATLAEPVPGAVSAELCRMARTNGIYLAAGLTERTGERLYNAALLISPEGQILLKHRKINVLQDVEGMYAIGDRLSVADTPFGRIGIDICADNMEYSMVLAEAMGRMGARMILAPSAWAVAPDFDNARTPYGATWTTPYRKLAKRYAMPVVGVSNVGDIPYGPWKGWHAIGNSIACGADGEIACVLPFGREAETVRVLALKIPDAPAQGTEWAAVLKREQG